MWNDVSKFKRWKYEILRHLYDQPLIFLNLANQVSFAKKDVIHALGALISQNLVKKERVTIEIKPEEGSELKAIADLLNKTTVKKKMTQYSLTERGLNRLAFWEHKYQLYQKVAMPWNTCYDDHYLREMQQRIEKNICKNSQS